MNDHIQVNICNNLLNETSIFPILDDYGVIQISFMTLYVGFLEYNFTCTWKIEIICTH